MMAPSAKLYTPRLLSLSAQLSGYPLTGDFDLTSQARSKTCGSTIEIGVTLDASGHLGRIGMMVSACAVGQSSAAVMAMAAKGRGRDDCIRTVEDIERWLSGPGDLPDWPGFDALAPALPYPARHGALLLPWRALIRVLSTEPLPSAQSNG